MYGLSTTCAAYRWHAYTEPGHVNYCGLVLPIPIPSTLLTPLKQDEPRENSLTHIPFPQLHGVAVVECLSSSILTIRSVLCHRNEANATGMIRTRQVEPHESVTNIAPTKVKVRPMREINTDVSNQNRAELITRFPSPSRLDTAPLATVGYTGLIDANEA